MIDSEPGARLLSTRTSWWLIAGGLAGVVASIPIGMLLSDVGEILMMVFTVFCGLVFACGVGLLAHRGWWVLAPALVIGVFAPLLFAMEAHEAVVTTFGAVENCAVVHAEESQGRRARRNFHVVDYVLSCPSGEMELSLDYSYRLRADEVAVVRLPPLRPLLARDVRYERELLVGTPIAMVGIVLVGAVVRPRRRG